MYVRMYTLWFNNVQCIILCTVSLFSYIAFLFVRPTTYIHTYIHTYTHTNIHASIHKSIHTCMHAYIYIYIYLHTMKYTRILQYTPTLSPPIALGVHLLRGAAEAGAEQAVQQLEEPVRDHLLRPEWNPGRHWRRGHQGADLLLRADRHSQRCGGQCLCGCVGGGATVRRY